MNAIVFLGPTLDPAEAAKHLDATFLPPAAQGDVYRAARLGPRAIGIVDGYFERVASVWHKEILWALSRGIHVFGAASMGALRAAELASYGMIGVGEVFLAFHRNELEDDDEVALLHGPAESQYKLLSEAMVNIRASFNAAVLQGILSRTEADRLVGIGKAIHYNQRTYRNILDRAGEQGIGGSTIDALAGWLPSGAINRKRSDAIGMLRAMRHYLATKAEPHEPSFVFEHTEPWEAARLHALSKTIDRRAADESLLTEELKVSGKFATLRRATLARVLAADCVEAGATQSDLDAMRGEIARFRLERDLLTEEEFGRWKSEQSFTDPQLIQAFKRQSALSLAELRLEQDIIAHLPEELKLQGEYSTTRARALRKREVLATQHFEQPSLSDIGLSEAELYEWYFAWLKVPVPKHVEPYARCSGFDDLASFRSAVLREYLFQSFDKRR